MRYSKAHNLARQIASERKLPRPVVYELQHAMSHLTSVHRHVDVQGKIGQYKKAIAHLERGILDAWKLFLFSDYRHADICSKKQQLADLFDCRLREYYAVPQHGEYSESEAPIERNRAVDYYSNKFKGMVPELPGNGMKAHSTVGTLGDTDKKFFEYFHQWAQYELIFTALLGKKDHNQLEQFMDAVFLGFSSEKMSDCVDSIQASIADEIMRDHEKYGLDKDWLGRDASARNRCEKAHKALDAGEKNSPAIKRFLVEDLLPAYGVGLQEF